MFRNMDKKEWLLLVFVLLFVVLPLLLFIGIQIDKLIRDAFGIESPDVKRGKQEVLIKDLQSEQRIQKKISDIKQRAKEAEANITVKTTKEIIKTEKKFENLKVKSKVTENEEKQLKKKVAEIKHKMIKIQPKNNKSTTEKKETEIVIDKTKYQETGYRNICNIWKAYEIVKDEK